METHSSRLKVGAVLFPGFELLDIYGPLEMFGLLPDKFSIVMLAERAGPVQSAQGPQGLADLSLSDATDIDILLVPGGIGTRKQVENPAFLEQLFLKGSSARFVASVCTGSSLLAKSALLDGRKATSNKLVFDWVVTQGPRVTWIRAARWVEDGKFFTSSGVSAGMDMTLGLIQGIFDRETSLRVARMAEYIWHENKADDPFAHLPVETNS